MRNTAFKKLRVLWGTSRFLIGRNKLTMVALGRDKESEYREGLSGLAQEIEGNCGLLFTNREAKDVRSYFEDFKQPQFARSGCIANRKFVVQPQVIAGAPVSMEPQLRKLGLPVRIKKGKIEIIAETTVCEKGSTLSQEQCKILELFKEKMVSFKIDIIGSYTNSTEKYTRF